MRGLIASRPSIHPTPNHVPLSLHKKKKPVRTTRPRHQQQEKGKGLSLSLLFSPLELSRWLSLSVNASGRLGCGGGVVLVVVVVLGCGLLCFSSGVVVDRLRLRLRLPGVAVMPAIVKLGGHGIVRHGGARYSNVMDSSLALSLAAGNGDRCGPSRKRCRVTAPFIFGGGGRADDQRKPKPCSVDALPDGCLFEIFRRLAGPQERSISACVSKRWLSLLSSIRPSEISTPSSGEDCPGSLKKQLPDLNEFESLDEEAGIDGDGRLTRSLGAKEATDVGLAALAVGTAGRGGLGKLSIRGSHPTRGVTDLGLSAISRGCPSLRVLAMCMVPLATDAGLSEIAEGCPMLEKLDLCECPLISDEGLIAVARKCPNLTSLTIEACARIGNEGLQAIGRHCPKLQSISIKDCILVGDQGIASIVHSASSSLTKIALQGLNISDVALAVIGHYGKDVIDLALTGLHNVNEKGFWVMGSASGLQKLKSFSVTSCRGVTDLGLEAIAKGCPTLKQLCLRGCSKLSDAGLKAFVEASRVLEKLQLEGCNGITLLGVLSGLLSCNSKLKTLGLVRCLGIKDIGSCPNQLPICKSLRSLTVRDCPGFTSRSLAFVGKICPQLQQIDLRGLVGVTDAGLLPLVESSQAALVKVDVSGCVHLTDAAIVAVVKAHGGSLQLLHLAGCKNITDRSLLAISDSCSALVDLDMSRCGVSDYGAAALASARQLELQMLSLAGCSKVTEKSLPFLGNLGQSLAGLNLQRCNLIGDHGIALLEAKLWWCDILS